MVQWLAEKGQQAGDQELAALHMTGKHDALMRQYGGARPWSVVKADFDGWFGAAVAAS